MRFCVEHILETADPGGMNYNTAFEQARCALSSLICVERKHIVLLSDGKSGDDFAVGLAIRRRHRSAFKKCMHHTRARTCTRNKDLGCDFYFLVAKNCSQVKFFYIGQLNAKKT